MAKRKHSKQRRGENPPHKHKNPSHKGVEEHFLFGIHAVRAALANPKRILIELQATQNALKELADTLESRAENGFAPLSITPTTPEKLNRLFRADTVHQGVALRAHALPEVTLEEVMASGKPLLVLDKITDPRNIGAIMRAAAVFGAGGLIVTRRNAPPSDGALAKTASGAVEHVPFVPVANLARCLAHLAENNYTPLGLDEAGDMLLADFLATHPAQSPIALVLGAEGRGLRRLTRENCTQLVRLPHNTPQDAPFACLNVATAAAIALYALTR